jgi:hypothetical protein
VGFDGESVVIGENSMNRPATILGESSSSSSCVRRRAEVAFGTGMLRVETGIGNFGRFSGGRFTGEGGGEILGNVGVVVGVACRLSMRITLWRG